MRDTVGAARCRQSPFCRTLAALPHAKEAGEDGVVVRPNMRTRDGRTFTTCPSIRSGEELTVDYEPMALRQHWASG